MKVHRAFALHCDVPPGRARAWNVAAGLFAVGDLYAAHRFAVLGWVLGIAAGMVAVTGVALARIARRHEREGQERRAAWAAHCQPQAPAAPVTERQEVAA